MCKFYCMRAGNPFHVCAAALLLLLDSGARAGADVCADPGDQSFASAGFVNHERSRIEPGPGRTNQENQNLDLTFASGTKRFLYGFGHRYVIFDFDGVEPQTNAHLHTSFFPLHWNAEERNFRLSAAVALSASSNIMGHPREYEGDSLQLLVALVSGTPLSERLSVRYGICGDHRFGEYALYPTAGIEWRPHADWTFDMAFPLSRITYDVANDVSTAVQIAPDGNEWHVTDRNFDAESKFVYESIALEWLTRWHVHPRLTLSLSLGRQLRNRFEMTLMTGERVFLSGEPANRIGAAVRWRF
jgi:hypothetical protein